MLLGTDTAERRSQGLSGREGLAPGRGMLFPYTEATDRAFWMVGMRFDIDIVWIRGTRVVDITHDARHDILGEPIRYRPRVPANRVLEVASGTAKRLGWKPGMDVGFDPPLETLRWVR